MSTLINLMIKVVTKLHTKLLSINDNGGFALSDKQLHFLIIGLFGFFLLLILQPLFEWFFRHDGILFVTFGYVFTIILVVTFAIEIGQGFSGTGDMDFYDLIAGVFGFFVFFAIYLLGYLFYRNVKRKNSDNNENKEG